MSTYEYYTNIGYQYCFVAFNLYMKIQYLFQALLGKYGNVLKGPIPSILEFTLHHKSKAYDT